jgi:hypothetical protein
MASEEPRDEKAADLGGTYDTLRRLERRLDEASQAAERLIAQAASEAARAAAGTRAAGSAVGGTSAAGGAGPVGDAGDARPAADWASTAAGAGPAADPDLEKPPPAGWQIPSRDGTAASEGERDLELLTHILQSLKDLIPPDLQRRIAEALREVLLALRALIDWYLERLEQRRSEPVKVQDIPIV